MNNQPATEFGRLLRSYRNKSTDPINARRLSQARLGELIGEALGDRGYSAAAVSEWERGKSRIHVDDRRVLLSLITVLQECGGLEILEQADALLRAGNYRALNEEEKEQVFPGSESPNPEHSDQLEADTRQVFPWEGLLSTLVDRYRSAAAHPTPGPTPQWARVLLDKLSVLTNRWSSAQVARATAWVATWLASWVLTFPLLRWPFAGIEQARSAALWYMVGALVSPLLIGGLTRTWENRYWRQHRMERMPALRIFTHLGAAIGYFLGNILVFSLGLLGYYLGLSPWPPMLEGLIAAGPILFSHAVAVEVPFVLWRAYGRLRLGDGLILFVILLAGPLWGVFFYNYYPLFLARALGPALILFSIGSLAGIATWQKKRTDTAVIPAYVWTALFGVIAVLFAAIENGGVFDVSALACLIAALVRSMARGRTKTTLPGVVGLLLLLVLIYVGRRIVWWAALFPVIVAALVWLRGGRNYLSFAASFWGVLAAIILGRGLISQAGITEIQAAIALTLVTGGFLWFLE